MRPRLRVDRPVLSFRDGVGGASPAPQTVHVSREGDRAAERAAPFPPSTSEPEESGPVAAVKRGPHAEEFGVEPATREVPEGGSASFEISFQPSAPGQRTATVEFIDAFSFGAGERAGVTLVGVATPNAVDEVVSAASAVSAASPPQPASSPRPTVFGVDPGAPPAGPVEGERMAYARGAPRAERNPREQIPVNRGGREPAPGPAGADGVTPTRQAPAAAPLTNDQRTQLKFEIVSGMGQAYTDFSSACDANKSAIKDAAKKDGDFAALLVEVGVGILLPGLSTRIGNFLKRITPDASEGMRLVVRHLQNSGDNAKAHLNAIVKVGAFVGIKSRAKQLFGDSEATRFVEHLRDEFAKGQESIVGRLSDMTDAQLAALRATYDRSVVSASIYREAIADLVARFQANVGAVGDLTGGLEMYQEHLFPHYVRMGSETRLALLHEGSINSYSPGGGAGPGKADSYRFSSWVDPQFAEMAIRKARSKGNTVRTLDATDVGGLP